MKYIALLFVFFVTVQGCLIHLLDCMTSCGANQEVAQSVECIESVACYDNCYTNMTNRVNSGQCSRFDDDYPTLPPETEAPTTEAPTTAAPTTKAPTTAAPTTTARPTTRKTITLPPKITFSRNETSKKIAKPTTTRTHFK
ncbi:hypothetical protein LEN26_002107 [Aphanomyces euteiches]|nr:hypothetical protein LEN26_002107 [Aphanomyces euteiches]